MSEECPPTPKPKTGLRKRWPVLILCLVLLALVAYGLHSIRHRNDWIGEPLGFEASSITITIPRGASAREIGRILREEGVLSERQSFDTLLRRTQSATQLRAGTYRVTPDMTPMDLVALLRSNSAGGIRVTLVEGWTTEQMMQKLVDEGVLTDLRAFTDAVENNPRIAAWAPERDNLNGFLGPDTYLFVPGMSPTEIVDDLVSGFERSIDVAAFTASVEALGLTLPEAVTLASIIEREARTDDERPTIARVFLNRLDRDMKLESCATVHFAIGDWSRPLRIADTEVDHPYNTYEIEGLPPGPICNPGPASLNAVANPGETDDLFFVYDEALGHHRFSRTFAEHQRAIRAANGN